MHTGVHIHTRDEFIALGNVIGEALHQNPRENPWFISLQGDMSSGKELVALAIDQALNPQRYPKGIEKDHSAEMELRHGNGRTFPVVFSNFRNRYAPHPGYFDGYLQEFQRANPNAYVLVASNISRPGTFESYRSAEHMQSDLLDVGLEVYKRGAPFVRAVELSFKNEPLLAHVVTEYNARVKNQVSVPVAAPARPQARAQASAYGDPSAS